MPRNKAYTKPQPPKLTAGDVGESVAEELTSADSAIEVSSNDLLEEMRALRQSIEDLTFVIKLTNGI